MVSGTTPSSSSSSSPPWFSSPTHAASPAAVLSMMNVALRSNENEGGGNKNKNDNKDHHHHHHHGGSIGSNKKKKNVATAVPATERLRAQAPRLLKQIDDSDLFLRSGSKQRQISASSSSSSTAALELARSIPTFDKDEVVLGPLLGVGGFCSVYQVEAFRLKDDDGHSHSHSQGAPSKPTEVQQHAVVVAPSEDPHDHIDNDNDSHGERFWASSVAANRRRRAAGGGGGGSCASSVASTLSSGGSSPASSLHGGHLGGAWAGTMDNGGADHRHLPALQLHHHARMDPRLFMQQRARRRTRTRGREAQRDGKAAAAAPDQNDHEDEHSDARYAIKRLHWDTLNEFERVRGAIDLAMEAKYLSALRHPNIVKMRGVASGDVLDKSFFIILDRLYGTLADKIKAWKQAQRECRGGWFGLFPDHDRMEHILIERLIVAYDLSSALSYMHKNRLVYRDIKKENIGFDIRGDAKIFDFGLSKCLSQDLKAHDPVTGEEVYGYRLTPRTGSVCTMAPEVASGRPYDEKCDVFSFAILLWEILALESPFPAYSRKEYMFRVVELEERPWIPVRWPSVTKKLLRHAWDGDPERRPDMRKASAMLRADLNTLTDAPEVKNRTIHMLNRSTHSFCMEPREVSCDREGDDARAWHEDDMSYDET